MFGLSSIILFFFEIQPVIIDICIITIVTIIHNTQKKTLESKGRLAKIALDTGQVALCLSPP